MAGDEKKSGGMMETLTMVMYVIAWYAGNTYYNIYNKKALNLLHAHWTVAFAQLVV